MTQLFSEDYLMHHGVKGMKWKKRKRRFLEEPKGRFETPEEYMYEAGQEYHRQVEKKGGTADKGKWMREFANQAHRQDQGYARQQAYKKNQKRIAKQMRQKKINRLKMKLGRKVGLYRIKPTHEVTVKPKKVKLRDIRR